MRGAQGGAPRAWPLADALLWPLADALLWPLADALLCLPDLLGGDWSSLRLDAGEAVRARFEISRDCRTIERARAVHAEVCRFAALVVRERARLADGLASLCAVLDDIPRMETDLGFLFGPAERGALLPRGLRAHLGDALAACVSARAAQLLCEAFRAQAPAEAEERLARAMAAVRAAGGDEAGAAQSAHDAIVQALEGAARAARAAPRGGLAAFAACLSEMERRARRVFCASCADAVCARALATARARFLAPLAADAPLDGALVRLCGAAVLAPIAVGRLSAAAPGAALRLLGAAHALLGAEPPLVEWVRRFSREHDVAAVRTLDALLRAGRSGDLREAMGGCLLVMRHSDQVDEVLDEYCVLLCDRMASALWERMYAEERAIADAICREFGAARARRAMCILDEMSAPAPVLRVVSIGNWPEGHSRFGMALPDAWQLAFEALAAEHPYARASRRLALSALLTTVEMRIDSATVRMNAAQAAVVLLFERPRWTFEEMRERLRADGPALARVLHSLEGADGHELLQRVAPDAFAWNEARRHEGEWTQPFPRAPAGGAAAEAGGAAGGAAAEAAVVRAAKAGGTLSRSALVRAALARLRRLEVGAAAVEAAIDRLVGREYLAPVPGARDAYAYVP
jgi:hypothetical protein